MKFFALSLNESKRNKSMKTNVKQKRTSETMFSVYFLENCITVLLKFLDIFF